MSNKRFVVHTFTNLSLQAMGLAKLDKNVQQAVKMPRGKRKTPASTAACKDGASLQENVEPEIQVCFHLTPQN